MYYWDGSWRDICILHTNRKDWKVWADYVNRNYPIGWFNGKTGKLENQVDFEVIEEFWDGKHHHCSTARVFIGKIQINAHFFEESEIENDIDPGEFNSIEEHDKLIEYMSALSKLLGREIVLTLENEHESILFKINKNRIKFSEVITPHKKQNWELIGKNP